MVLKQTENVNVLEEYLANLDSDKTVPQYTTPEMLKDTTKKLDKVAIIARATAQYKTTLMTRLFGLGIDFSVRDKMLWDKGGVHIILGFCPEDLIEEVQIKGRTCCENESGSIQKIYGARSDQTRHHPQNRNGRRSG